LCDQASKRKRKGKKKKKKRSRREKETRERVVQFLVVVGLIFPSKKAKNDYAP
jgi:hypothetical protein